MMEIVCCLIQKNCASDWHSGSQHYLLVHFVWLVQTVCSLEFIYGWLPWWNSSVLLSLLLWIIHYSSTTSSDWGCGGAFFSIVLFFSAFGKLNHDFLLSFFRLVVPSSSDSVVFAAFCAKLFLSFIPLINHFIIRLTIFSGFNELTFFFELIHQLVLSDFVVPHGPQI